MKLNLNTTLIGLNGSPIKDGDKDATLGVIAARALATPLERDKGSQPESVITRWRLAMKLQIGAPDTELSPEQVTEVRSRIAEVFALEVAGPALELLNG